MTGIWKAYDLTKRVSALEDCVRLCQYLQDRLKYLRPSVFMLVDAAAASGEFEGLGFLRECAESLRNGVGFRESWREPAMGASGLLGKDAAMLVAGLCDILGASELESQLSELDYTKNLLGIKLTEARDYAQKHKKLYRTLGVLGGAGIAVLLY